MRTTVSAKGQVTLPKSVREAAGIRPGDRVEVRATAAGSVVIEKPPGERTYRERALALADRRLVRGMTTDAFMELSRGEARPARRRR